MFGGLMELKNMPNILKTRDVAILLDLSPDTVNDMARKGIIKGYKSGNQWRFRKKDIEKFLRKYTGERTSGAG
jgi:excisionase family DNA binding protein